MLFKPGQHVWVDHDVADLDSLGVVVARHPDGVYEVRVPVLGPKRQFRIIDVPGAALDPRRRERREKLRRLTDEERDAWDKAEWDEAENPPQGRCKKFHGADACEVIAETAPLWVPGRLVMIGECRVSEYIIIDERSKKGLNRYVHDHDGGVKIYRRARDNERADLTYKTFPKTLTVLGSWPGCTYVPNGSMLEKKLRGSSKMFAATPDGKRLVILHEDKGVVYLVRGGKFRITDWMRG